MDDLVILYYDSNQPKKDIYDNFMVVKKALSDKNVICIPKNYDILINASLDELFTLQEIIAAAIEIKATQMKVMESDLPKM